LTKTQLYWLLQVGGWSFFCFTELVRYATFVDAYDLLLLNGAVNIALGIAVTHVYRTLVLRINLLALPIRRLAPRALLGVLVTAAFMVAVNLPMDMAMFPGLVSSPLQLSDVVFTYLNWAKYLLMWVSFYHLYHFADRLARTELAQSEMQRHQTKMELQRLRSQLNPHFLFNALNSLRAVVLVDPSRAQQGITRLASLLRSSLRHNESGTIPLSEELEAVRNYLALEALRLEDRLQVDYAIDPETEAVPVPAMLLLTLVENAIKHGVAPNPKGGQVVISSSLQHRHMLLRIRNTGEFAPQPNDDSYGLWNSQQRLHLLYGELASLQVGPAEPGWVEAVWHQPLPPSRPKSRLKRPSRFTPLPPTSPPTSPHERAPR